MLNEMQTRIRFMGIASSRSRRRWPGIVSIARRRAAFSAAAVFGLAAGVTLAAAIHQD
jgi:hypothetical protein